MQKAEEGAPEPLLSNLDCISVILYSWGILLHVCFLEGKMLKLQK